VSFILLMILGVVTGLDLLSKAIRLRFIQVGTSSAQMKP
jgi:ABC-type phosphate/phosphonate transport system permease subunit